MVYVLKKNNFAFCCNTFILWALFSLLAIAVTAQINKIDTDRPDQTESPYTVPKKWVQIEAGLIIEKQNLYFTNFTIPTVLTKYGISKKTELRLITELSGNNSKLYVTNSTEISTPLQLGFKTSLWEEKGVLPKTSIIFHSALQHIIQYGQISVTSFNEIAVNYRFTFQNTLSKKISLGYNLGMEWERLKEAPAYVYTIAAGFDVNEKWYAYVESFGSVRKYEKPENSFDVGLARFLNSNIKIDISGGIGLSKDAPDKYFAIGASFRFKAGK